MRQKDAELLGWTFCGGYRYFKASKTWSTSATMTVGECVFEIQGVGVTKERADFRLIVAIEVFERHMPGPWRASSKSESTP